MSRSKREYEKMYEEDVYNDEDYHEELSARIERSDRKEARRAAQDKNCKVTRALCLIREIEIAGAYGKPELSALRSILEE